MLRSDWREKVLIVCIFLMALALRAGYLVELRQSPDFDSPVLDPQLNDYWARAMVSGDWTPPAHAPDPELRAAPFGRPPGYPYVLAAIYAVFGLGYDAPRLVQMAFGALNVVLLYVFARALYGRAAGIFAALLLMGCWPCVYFEGELNSPVFEVTLLLLLLHTLRRWVLTSNAAYAVLAGVVLGGFALIRPNAMLLGPAAASWMILDATGGAGNESPGKGPGWRRRIGAAALLLAASAVTVSPAIIRNYRMSGDFVFISYYGGVNAYIGNNPESDGVSPKIPELRALSGLDTWNCFSYPQLVRGMALKRGDASFDFAAASRYFYDRALQFIRSEPLEALALTARKAAFFLGPAEVSDSKEVALERLRSRVLRTLPGFAVLLGLAVGGLFVLFCFGVPGGGNRAAPQLLRASMLLAFAYFLSVLPFFVTARYRVPVLPVLALLGGCGVSVLVRLALRGCWTSLGAAAAATALLFLLCQTAIVAYQPDLARWHVERGIAFDSKGRTAKAEQEFACALKADSDCLEAHLRLGYAAARRADFDTALRHYRRAVRSDQRNSLARNNLGFELARRGALLEAEQEYRAALASNPFSALASNNLGILLLEQDRFSDAETVLARALAAHPDDANLLSNLGLVYYRQGELQRAAEHFREAVRVVPGHARAWFNLGELFIAAQRPEAAAACYRNAVHADPAFEAARERLEDLEVGVPSNAGS